MGVESSILAFRREALPTLRYFRDTELAPWPCWNCTTSYNFSVSVKKMGQGWTGGASDIVKAESSGEYPRATGGLVSNLPHLWVHTTKQHTYSGLNKQYLSRETVETETRAKGPWEHWWICKSSDQLRLSVKILLGITMCDSINYLSISSLFLHLSFVTLFSLCVSLPLVCFIAITWMPYLLRCWWKNHSTIRHFFFVLPPHS